MPLQTSPHATADASIVAPRAQARTPISEDEIKRLGDAIAELSARIQAATYELLVLIREFDERACWNDGACLSCAHWLSWRTGLDPCAAREKVRVARALARLPRISAAMQRGELSYSKVRALTRIATPDNEKRLLGAAQGGTASHVERLVRAWRRADRLDEARETTRRHQQRSLQTWVDEDGMLVIRGRLTPELGAVVQRTLEAAGDRLFRESMADPRDDATAEVTPTQRRADALGLLAESALARDLDRGTAGDRYQVVLHVDEATLNADDRAAETETVAPDAGQAVLEDVDGGARFSRNVPPHRLRRVGRDDATRARWHGARCRPEAAHDPTSDPPGTRGPRSPLPISWLHRAAL